MVFRISSPRKRISREVKMAAISQANSISSGMAMFRKFISVAQLTTETVRAKIMTPASITKMNLWSWKYGVLK